MKCFVESSGVVKLRGFKARVKTAKSGELFAAPLFAVVQVVEIPCMKQRGDVRAVKGNGSWRTLLSVSVVLKRDAGPVEGPPLWFHRSATSRESSKRSDGPWGTNGNQSTGRGLGR